MRELEQRGSCGIGCPAILLRHGTAANIQVLFLPLLNFEYLKNMRIRTKAPDNLTEYDGVIL